jgi:putative Mn2+ efflux pump MntP
MAAIAARGRFCYPRRDAEPRSPVVSTWEVLAIAFGLAMDASAVALGAGSHRLSRNLRFRFRVAFHFGLFQFMMPLAGWLVGAALARYVAAVDHWVAFFILVYVGARMIRAGLGADVEREVRDPSRGLTLVMLSVATSIDAFAVGLSLAMLDADIWWASVTIGAVTGLLAAVALRAGRVLGALVGRRMEVAGGLVLLGIGIRILVQHLAGGP